jgi:two-component system sensor histidine kinase BarA
LTIPVFRNSIRTKLALLVLTSVGIAVLLVAGVSAWRDGRRDAALQADRLRATAAMLASLTAEPAWRHDAPAAFSALRSIQLLPGVVYARIDDGDGKLLAETGSGSRLIRDADVTGGVGARSMLSMLHSSTLQATAPVVYATRPAGRITLVAKADNNTGRLLDSLLVTALAALVATLCGLAAAWRMQRRITTPIVALTEAMGQVRQSHDYAGQVDIAADDEIGELVTGFNQMLGEIRTRDQSIAKHLAGLEQTVSDRTADLVVARDAAQSANAAKSDFLATMSHEIRTPMNGIMVMAEMLAVGELPKRQRRFAEVIAKSGASLLAIINDILDFSKIEAGKMELEQAPVDVADAAEDVCALFWERARSKGLDLAAYIDPATPQLISADPTRLRQVIGNLVNNAIKFTETGGVLVRVEPVKAGLRISVLDTGIGIAADKLATVFGAFSQADQTTTRKYGGTGLGLAISKRLVQAMGGDIRVSSQLGRGSNFAFQIPATVIEPARAWPKLDTAFPVALGGLEISTRNAMQAYVQATGGQVTALDPADAPGCVIASAQTFKSLPAKLGPSLCIGEYGDGLPADLKRSGLIDVTLVQPFRRRDLVALLDQLARALPLTDAAEETADTVSARFPSFAGRRILIADDSAVNREVAMEALSRLGAACEVAVDGRQAVDAVVKGGFDLVLMDGSMPEMDGYDATREIRRLELEMARSPTPIIALTAHVVGSAAEAWREAGMDAVLHKPFTLKSLAATLGQFLTTSPDAGEVAIEQADPAPAPAAPAADGRDLLDPVVTAELAAMAQNGRQDFVDRVRQLYRDNAPAALAKVIEAAQAADAPAAAIAVHALKSMSMNIGAKAVAEQAAWMEKEARDHGRVRTSDAESLHRDLLATLAALGGDAPAGEPQGEDALARDLEGAIERGEFSLLYQAQVDRAGEVVVGVEVLLRWTHATRGLVSPALFIPLAERRGMMRPITRWVVDQAMTETAHLAPLSISFNASALEFADPTFADEIAVLIARHRFDPARLEVEVTETAILSDGEEVRRTMARLHELGLRIALDDFGVGHSSLSHLRFYPFDKLKIDKSFVEDCSIDVQSATLVHAVVSIGRALGMKVVAEGIENDQQQKFLKAAGVHAFQGYLFGRPEPVAALASRLNQPILAEAF